MSKTLLMIALLGMATVTLAKSNATLLRTKACVGRDGGDCNDDTEEEGIDLIKTELPQKPSSDLETTLQSLEDWNDYLDKMVNPNPMAAASERAALLAATMKRKHKQQEMELADSNQQLRMSTKGGLMRVLSKFALRWEAEQRLQAEEDRRKADLQHIRDTRQRLEAQSDQLRALSRAAGGKPKPTGEQLVDIVNLAKENQETSDNAKAFAWLEKVIKDYKPAEKKK